MRYVLGISAFYHDSAAALLADGRIVAAAQEERFTRKRHDFSFPANAIRYCLGHAGIGPSAVECVAFYDKPFLKFERILETVLATAPLGLRPFLEAVPLWIQDKLWTKDLIRKELGFKGPVLFPEHHQSHAASAFFPSPYEEAAFLTLDGVGEWATASIGTGKGNRIDILSEIHFPHSLGLLYSAFTYYAGFKVNSGEHKLMGLAPYGRPRYKDLILSELMDLKDDGSFRLNLKYFGYCSGLRMTNARFHKLFGGPPRVPESPITEKEMDLARSVQEATEEVVLRCGRHVHAVTGMKRLCLAGGVALNCVANGRLLREGPFEDIWVQPAAGDAGGAVGAACLAWHDFLGEARPAPVGDGMSGACLGPAYSEDEIGEFLARKDIPHEKLDPGSLAERVADLINDQKVVGWFQGRMEFGPRALGARSILADARSPGMQKKINLKVKFREGFRPFAPSVLRERVSDYFDLDRDSPYMLLVAPVKASLRREMTAEEKARFGIDRLNAVRSVLPAVTHVDYSARIQTVDSRTHPLFYALLQAMDRKYGCPAVVNTSFNVRGEPIVRSPEDAYRCFMRTNIDVLVMGNFVLQKNVQPSAEKKEDWQLEFALD